MEEGVKNIKAGWYYFLNFYFWISVVLVLTLIIVGMVFYFKAIYPNIEIWTQNYDFVLQVIEKAKPLGEEYLNITLG